MGGGGGEWERVEGCGEKRERLRYKTREEIREADVLSLLRDGEAREK